MKRTVHIIILVFCILGILSLSGCATLLAIPTQIIGGTFKLLGQLIGLASRLPRPPPGVFGI